jgi:hypothetical protein
MHKFIYRVFIFIVAITIFTIGWDTIDTLKLGYPLLLYKDAVPTRLSLSRVVKVLCVGPSHDSPQPRVTTTAPDPTTWVGPEPPCVQRK